MSNQSLAALAAQQVIVIQELIANEGEITAEQETALNALVRKVDDCDMFMRRLDMEAEYFEAQAKLFADQAKRVKARRDWFTAYIKMVMQSGDMKEMVGERIKFVLQNNPPKAVIDDEALIPKEYAVTETITKIEKKRLLEDLKMGVPVPGAHLERDQRVVPKPNSVLIEKKETA